jgi:hypothetical protein
MEASAPVWQELFTIGKERRTMILTVWMISTLVLGQFLAFWHRKLMIQLQEIDPSRWNRLGGTGIIAHLWVKSLRYPFWSWRSLGFFMFGAYASINDAVFRSRARRFRVVFWLWLLDLAAALPLSHLVGPVK